MLIVISFVIISLLKLWLRIPLVKTEDDCMDGNSDMVRKFFFKLKFSLTFGCYLFHRIPTSDVFGLHWAWKMMTLLCSNCLIVIVQIFFSLMFPLPGCVSWDYIFSKELWLVSSVKEKDILDESCSFAVWRESSNIQDGGIMLYKLEACYGHVHVIIDVPAAF